MNNNDKPQSLPYVLGTQQDNGAGDRHMVASSMAEPEPTSPFLDADDIKALVSICLRQQELSTNSQDCPVLTKQLRNQARNRVLRPMADIHADIGGNILVPQEQFLNTVRVRSQNSSELYVLMRRNKLGMCFEMTKTQLIGFLGSICVEVLLHLDETESTTSLAMFLANRVCDNIVPFPTKDVMELILCHHQLSTMIQQVWETLQETAAPKSGDTALPGDAAVPGDTVVPSHTAGDAAVPGDTAGDAGDAAMPGDTAGDRKLDLVPSAVPSDTAGDRKLGWVVSYSQSNSLEFDDDNDLDDEEDLDKEEEEEEEAELPTPFVLKGLDGPVRRPEMEQPVFPDRKALMSTLEEANLSDRDIANESAESLNQGLAVVLKLPNRTRMTLEEKIEAYGRLPGARSPVKKSMHLIRQHRNAITHHTTFQGVDKFDDIGIDKPSFLFMVNTVFVDLERIQELEGKDREIEELNSDLESLRSENSALRERLRTPRNQAGTPRNHLPQVGSRLDRPLSAKRTGGKRRRS